MQDILDLAIFFCLTFAFGELVLPAKNARCLVKISRSPRLSMQNLCLSLSLHSGSLRSFRWLKRCSVIPFLCVMFILFFNGSWFLRVAGSVFCIIFPRLCQLVREVIRKQTGREEDHESVPSWRPPLAHKRAQQRAVIEWHACNVVVLHFADCTGRTCRSWRKYL